MAVWFMRGVTVGMLAVFSSVEALVREESVDGG